MFIWYSRKHHIPWDTSVGPSMPLFRTTPSYDPWYSIHSLPLAMERFPMAQPGSPGILYPASSHPHAPWLAWGAVSDRARPFDHLRCVKMFSVVVSASGSPTLSQCCTSFWEANPVFGVIRVEPNQHSALPHRLQTNM